MVQVLGSRPTLARAPPSWLMFLVGSQRAGGGWGGAARLSRVTSTRGRDERGEVMHGTKCALCHQADRSRLLLARGDTGATPPLQGALA
jgi:hypothetical protein